MAADDQARHASDDRADGCTSTRPDAGKDGTGESAGTGADDCSSSAGSNGMVILRRSRAAAQGEAAYRSGRDQQTFHRRPPIMPARTPARSSALIAVSFPERP